MRYFRVSHPTKLELLLPAADTTNSFSITSDASSGAGAATAGVAAAATATSTTPSVKLNYPQDVGSRWFVDLRYDLRACCQPS